jgi:hypothetical protein
MNKNILQKTLICLLGILLLSCKKEKDENGPKVTFNTPLSDQNFQIFDTIPVSVTISDETKITAATLSLVDQNYISVGQAIAIPVISSPNMTSGTEYILSNIHLGSGSYYLFVSASDGNNVSKTYQRIRIAEVPKKIKKIFVSTAVSQYETHLFFIDSAFNSMDLYQTFSGDCLSISTSSYFQEAFVCGYYSGGYSGFNLTDQSIKFNIPSSGNIGAPYFTAYYSEDKKNYVARYDEPIKGYDYSGNIIYNATANPGYYARKLYMNGVNLIAEEKQKTSSGKILVSFYSTGIAEQQTAISQDVLTFCEKDDHSVFVFGNLSGQGVIQLYDRLDNNLWNPYPYSLASGSILSAVKIDMDTYLIGHSNGTIYKYQYQNSSVTPYLTGYTAIQLKYDEFNNDVYIAEVNQVTRIDYPSKTIVNSITSTENITDISLLYNR